MKRGDGMLLSVGIPTFNQADFLEQTIESLLDQTQPPHEIVISDHFSTDRTPDIIRKFSGRVRAVKPPAGSNLTDQYNFTLASQTGDWISLLSSDDIARPRFCEVLARGAAARADAVLVRAGWENIDEKGATVGRIGISNARPVQGCPPPVARNQPFVASKLRGRVACLGYSAAGAPPRRAPGH